MAIDTFAREVEKRTNGRYKIQTFYSGSLGGERESIEAVQLGTQELAFSSTGPVPNFVPETKILDVPFLFRDKAHARAVLDGPIGQDLLKKLPAKGLVSLAWSENGFRHMTNNKRAINQATGLRFSLDLPDDAALGKLGKPGPDGEKVLDLADLALHGFIEHDASLTRRDARNGDAVELVKPLLDQLLSLSKDGKTLTREDLAVAHQLRLAQTAASGKPASLKAGVLGTLEAALLFLVLERDGVIALADAMSFLQDEHIPEHLAPRAIGPATIAATAALMAVEGNVPVFEAAKRAAEVEQTLVEPEAARAPKGE